MAVATFAAAMAIPVHHDVGWPLYVSERILAGAELYVDVVEVHPPLVIGVALIAVLIADLLSVSAILMYHTIALLAVLSSLALCWQVLARTRLRAAQAPVILIAAAFFLLPFVGYSFGQEEHFMLALVLPYLFMLGAITEDENPGDGVRVAAAVMAGIGFSMKPLYGPVWLALAVYLAIVRGPRALRSIEVLIPGAVMALYIAFTLLITPAYFPLMSLTSGVYFDYFPSPMSAVVLSKGMLVTAGAIVFHFAADARSIRRRSDTILAIALVGFMLVVLVQHKGWSYHWYPVYAAATLLVLQRLLEHVRAQAGPRLVAAAAVLAVALGGWRLTWTRTFWGELAGSPYHLPAMKGVVETYGDGGPIVALSTIMPPAFPLVNYADVEWASRFSCLWMLPGIYRDAVGGPGGFQYHDASNMTDIERYLFDAVAEDLLSSRPTLIIVDQAPPAQHMRGFDYLEYFSRDARLSEFFASYTVIGSTGRYQILKRSSPQRARVS